MSISVPKSSKEARFLQDRRNHPNLRTKVRNAGYRLSRCGRDSHHGTLLGSRLRSSVQTLPTKTFYVVVVKLTILWIMRKGLIKQRAGRV